MALSNDLREFLKLLVDHDVKFMLVGAHAVAIHGFVRNTEDIDFWIRRDPENVARVLTVLQEFGFGGLGLEQADLMDETTVIQLGRPPNRIDLLNFLTGLEFDDCYERRDPVTLGGVSFSVIALPDLLENKRKTARQKDLADVEEFERAQKSREAKARDS